MERITINVCSYQGLGFYFVAAIQAVFVEMNIFFVSDLHVTHALFLAVVLAFETTTSGYYFYHAHTRKHATSLGCDFHIRKSWCTIAGSFKRLSRHTNGSGVRCPAIVSLNRVCGVSENSGINSRWPAIYCSVPFSPRFQCSRQAANYAPLQMKVV